MTSFSLSYEKLIIYLLKPWRGEVSYNIQEKGVHAYLAQCAISHSTGYLLLFSKIIVVECIRKLI